MHRDRGRRTDVDGAGRAVLGDRESTIAGGPGHRTQSGALLPEEQDAPLREVDGLEWLGTRQVVHADEREALSRAPGAQGISIVVVDHMQVPVRDHGTPAIPAPTADDVHGRGVEGIRRPHDGSDVEVMGEVLDGDMEGPATGVEIRDDRIEPPVPVPVDHIARIAVLEELRVQPGILRPGSRMRPHADRRFLGIHDGDDSLEGMPSSLAAVPAIGPDMQQLLTDLGPIAFWVVVAIIFAECGLLIGFFLPGDSLLFITGLLIAQGIIGVNIWLGSLILVIAAIVGNVVGYWIGHKAGPALFRRPDSKLFRQEYVDKTHQFFERYGARAIVLARFVPIVRTFITAVAGVGRMDFRRFFTFSAIGAVLWAGLVTIAGYFLGNIPFVKNNIELILILVVVVSVVPLIVEYIKHRRERRAA